MNGVAFIVDDVTGIVYSTCVLLVRTKRFSKKKKKKKKKKMMMMMMKTESLYILMHMNLKMRKNVKLMKN